MTSDLTGLASLALAAQLDGEATKPPEQSTMTESETLMSDFMPPVTQAGIAIPKGRSFNHVTPRIVSIDHEDTDISKKRGHSPILTEDIVFDTPSEPPPPPPDPDEVISKVQEQDVLCGRGGETNNHKGNIYYRDLVKHHQRLYLKAKRRDKPRIARHIVDTIRRRNGRFLKKDASSNTWRDVGNNKAREKTSQALREGAPELRDDGGVQKTHHHYDVEDEQQQRRHKKRKSNPMLPDYTMDNMVNLVSPTPSSISMQESLSPTVSADADDDQRPNPPYLSPMKKTTVRGPRLAVLKARLMNSEGSYCF